MSSNVEVNLPYANYRCSLSRHPVHPQTDGAGISNTPNQPAQSAVSADIKRDIATYICSAREHAELIVLGRHHGEPLEPTTEDVLERDALDPLLDPVHPSAQRFQLFRRQMSGLIRSSRRRNW